MRRIRITRGRVLPVGLVVALAVSLLLPAPGARLGEVSVGPVGAAAVGAIVIFLISGYSIDWAGGLGRRFLTAIPVVLVANLVVPPLLAAVALSVLDLPLGVAFGIAVVSSVPTTLSTATVLTELSHGDGRWSVGLTLLCVIVGAFTAPVALSLVLATSVTVPVGELLVQVVLLVVIPLAVGVGASRVLRRDLPGWMAVVPSLAVVTLVWITMSGSYDEIHRSSVSRLLLIIAVAVVGHLLLLLLAVGCAALFPPAQGSAVLFVVAQKTLPLALTLIVAAADVAPDLAAAASAAVLMAVVWHFGQLLVDSALTGWRRRLTASPVA